jgi:hypothetical protein
MNLLQPPSDGSATTATLIWVIRCSGVEPPNNRRDAGGDLLGDRQPIDAHMVPPSPKRVTVSPP